MTTNRILGPEFSKTNEPTSPQSYIYSKNGVVTSTGGNDPVESIDTSGGTVAMGYGSYLFEADPLNGKDSIIGSADKPAKVRFCGPLSPEEVEENSKTGKWIPKLIPPKKWSDPVGFTYNAEEKAYELSDTTLDIGFRLYPRKVSDSAYSLTIPYINTYGVSETEKKSVFKPNADVGYVDLPFVPYPGDHSTLSLSVDSSNATPLWDFFKFDDIVANGKTTRVLNLASGSLFYDLSYSSKKGVYFYDAPEFESRSTPSVYFLNKNLKSSLEFGIKDETSYVTSFSDLGDVHKNSVHVVSGNIEYVPGLDYHVDHVTKNISMHSLSFGGVIPTREFKEVDFGFSSVTFKKDGTRINPVSVDSRTGYFTLSGPMPADAVYTTEHWVKTKTIFKEVLAVIPIVPGDTEEPPYVVGYAKTSRSIIPGSSNISDALGAGKSFSEKHTAGLSKTFQKMEDSKVFLSIVHKDGTVLFMSYNKKAVAPKRVTANYDAMSCIKGSLKSWVKPASPFKFTVDNDAASVSTSGIQLYNKDSSGKYITFDMSTLQIRSRSGSLLKFDPKTISYDKEKGIISGDGLGKEIAPGTKVLLKYTYETDRLPYGPIADDSLGSTLTKTDVLLVPGYDLLLDLKVGGTADTLSTGNLISFSGPPKDGVVEASSKEFMAYIASNGVSSHALKNPQGNTVSVITKIKMGSIPTTELPSVRMYVAPANFTDRAAGKDGASHTTIGECSKDTSSFKLSSKDALGMVAGSIVSISDYLYRVVSKTAEGSNSLVNISPSIIKSGTTVYITQKECVYHVGGRASSNLLVDDRNFWSPLALKYKCANLNNALHVDFLGKNIVFDGRSIRVDGSSNGVPIGSPLPSEVTYITDSLSPIPQQSQIFKPAYNSSNWQWLHTGAVIPVYNALLGRFLPVKVKTETDVKLAIRYSILIGNVVQLNVVQVRSDTQGIASSAQADSELISGSEEWLSINGYSPSYVSETGESTVSNPRKLKLYNGVQALYVCYVNKGVTFDSSTLLLLAGVPVTQENILFSNMLPLPETFYLRSKEEYVPLQAKPFVHVVKAPQKFPIGDDSDVILVGPETEANMVKIPSTVDVGNNPTLSYYGYTYPLTGTIKATVDLHAFNFVGVGKASTVFCFSDYKNPTQWLVKVLNGAPVGTAPSEVDQVFTKIGSDVKEASLGQSAGGIPEIKSASGGFGGKDVYYNLREISELAWWGISKVGSISSAIASSAYELQKVIGIKTGGTDWSSPLDMTKYRLPGIHDVVAQGVTGSSRLFPSWNSRQTPRAFGNTAAPGTPFVSYGSFGVLPNKNSGATSYVLYPEGQIVERIYDLKMTYPVPLLASWVLPSAVKTSMLLSGNPSDVFSWVQSDTKNPAPPESLIIPGANSSGGGYNVAVTPPKKIKDFTRTWRHKVFTPNIATFFKKTKVDIIPIPSPTNKYLVSYNSGTSGISYPLGSTEPNIAWKSKVPFWDEGGFAGASAFATNSGPYGLNYFALQVKICRDGLVIRNRDIFIELADGNHNTGDIVYALNRDSVFSNDFTAYEEDFTPPVDANTAGKVLFAGSEMDPGLKESKPSATCVCIRLKNKVGDSSSGAYFYIGTDTSFTVNVVAEDGESLEGATVDSSASTLGLGGYYYGPNDIESFLGHINKAVMYADVSTQFLSISENLYSLLRWGRVYPKDVATGVPLGMALDTAPVGPLIAQWGIPHTFYGNIKSEINKAKSYLASWSNATRNKYYTHITSEIEKMISGWESDSENIVANDAGTFSDFIKSVRGTNILGVDQFTTDQSGETYSVLLKATSSAPEYIYGESVVGRAVVKFQGQSAVVLTAPNYTKTVKTITSKYSTDTEAQSVLDKLSRVTQQNGMLLDLNEYELVNGFYTYLDKTIGKPIEALSSLLEVVGLTPDTQDSNLYPLTVLGAKTSQDKDGVFEYTVTLTATCGLLTNGQNSVGNLPFNVSAPIKLGNVPVMEVKFAGEVQIKLENYLGASDVAVVKAALISGGFDSKTVANSVFLDQNDNKVWISTLELGLKFSSAVDSNTYTFINKDAAHSPLGAGILVPTAIATNVSGPEHSSLFLAASMGYGTLALGYLNPSLVSEYKWSDYSYIKNTPIVLNPVDSVFEIMYPSEDSIVGMVSQQFSKMSSSIGEVRDLIFNDGKDIIGLGVKGLNPQESLEVDINSSLTGLAGAVSDLTHKKYGYLDRVFLHKNDVHGLTVEKKKHNLGFLSI